VNGMFETLRWKEKFVEAGMIPKPVKIKYKEEVWRRSNHPTSDG